jgi:hypothetical protein
MNRRMQRSIDNEFECGTVVSLYICFPSPVFSVQMDYFCQANESILKKMNFVAVRKLVSVIE